MTEENTNTEVEETNDEVEESTTEVKNPDALLKAYEAEKAKRRELAQKLREHEA